MTGTFRQRNKGFTLAEMIVGVGLFSLLFILIVAAFFYLVDIQRKVDSKQQILNDFRFAVDVMLKEISSGSAFPAGCEDGCANLVFITKVRPDVPQRIIEYRYDAVEDTVKKAEQRSFGLCENIPFDSRCYQPVMGDSVTIESLVFYVSNKQEYTQPIITVEITGKVLPGTRQEESFRLTSSVTPRLLQDSNVSSPI